MVNSVDSEPRTEHFDETVLPIHDEISRSRRLLSVLAIAVAICLLMLSTVRLANVVDHGHWWLVAVMLLGVVVADFVSGIVHWAADTWGSESMPILGRRLLHPFRVHHVNPADFLTRRFVDTNGDLALLVIPIMAAALCVPLRGSAGIGIATAMTAFALIGMMTNQIHQWAHQGSPPMLIEFLQQHGILLGRGAHLLHHRAPHDCNYCIATGWCNRPLAAIDFFRRAERFITRLTSVTPRADDDTFRSIAWVGPLGTRPDSHAVEQRVERGKIHE